VFCAALLNSQPMGFYAPAQLVRDAQEHGVEVRPADVNFSDYDSTLEPKTTGGWALRLGLRQIGGLRADAAAKIMAARDRPYDDIPDLQKRARITAPIVRRLAEADAMRAMFIDRRQALWEAKALRDAPDLPLFQEVRDEGAEMTVPLPAMPVCEQVVADYQTTRLSLKAHPMAFLRKSMRKQGFMDTAQLKHSRPWQKVKMAGLVLIRQKPGTAKGVCFITIEDEVGVANVVVWPKMMEAYRKVVMQSRLLMIEGYVQRDVEIIHVVAQHLEDRSDALMRLAPEGMEAPLARADEVRKPIPAQSRTHPRNVRIIPKSRDFQAREHLWPVSAQDHDVFQAQAKPPRQVDARLNGKYHALVQNTLRRGGQIGRFMHLNAHTVAQTVGEIGTISGICDDLPRGIIHHMRLYTGARGRHRGLHGRLDNRMHLHEPVRCRTHHCHAGDIAGIAIFAAANIHHHRITGLQQRLAGLMMGERAIAARTNDGKQRLHALPFEAGAHDLGHVQLGHAHLHLRPRRLHRHICRPRICLQHRIFIRILAHPQRTNGCGCELPRGTGQRILHKCCEIRAHRLVQNNRLRGLRT